MTKKLEGKTAVITGGTEGIGFATAKLFVTEGAYVFITGRRQKELDEAVKAIGTNVSGVQGDVTQLADLDRLYETVSKAKRRIESICPGKRGFQYDSTTGTDACFCITAMTSLVATNRAFGNFFWIVFTPKK